MLTQRNLLIVIADGEHVRFVRPGANGALHSDRLLDSIAAHKRSSDLESDHPGASFHTGSSEPHGVQPRHDPHLLEKAKFAQLVGSQLNAASARGEFDDVVIVAPPRTLNEIERELDEATAAKVIGKLQKDLVKTPDDHLWPHLSAWVPPVQRTVD